MNVTTASRLRRSGKVLAIALPIVGIAGLSTLVMLPNQSSAQPADPPKLEDIAPRSMIVGAELARLHITSETMAAAGISSSTAATVVRALGLDSDFGVGVFRAAREQHGKAAGELAEIERRLRSGRSRDGDLSRAREKREYVEVCEAACESAIGSIDRLLREALTAQQAAALATIRANVGEGVPLPYAATSLTEIDRVRLRDALTAKSFADRTGSELPGAHASFLATVDARPEITSARFGSQDAMFIENACRVELSQLDN